MDIIDGQLSGAFGKVELVVIRDEDSAGVIRRIEKFYSFFQTQGKAGGA